MKNKNNFEKELNILTKYHFKKSKEYQKILKGLGYKNTNGKIENLPFLTTSIFKELELKSIPKNKIYKIFSSSGTSSPEYISALGTSSASSFFNFILFISNFKFVLKLYSLIKIDVSLLLFPTHL